MPHACGPHASFGSSSTSTRGYTVLMALCALLLTGCGGGGGVGGGNDGEFVGRTGIVVTGIADDGTATSPLDGAVCRAVTQAGVELDRATTDADGNFLLLVDPGQQVSLQCFAAGQGNLRLRRFISTVGLPEGGELPGQDLLPATTVVSRIVGQEAADTPTLDVAGRFDALLAGLVPFGSDAAPADADLQLLADAFTLVYDRLRDAGVDAETEALLADLYDDGDIDLGIGDELRAALNTELSDLAAAAGRAVPDAVLATHPSFPVTFLNAGGGATNLLQSARFATVLREARAAAGDGGLVTLSAGDQIASRVELVPSFEDGTVFYDADVVDALDFDVLGLGPQDLELGPAVAATFLGELDGDAVVVATDLLVNNEAQLTNLSSEGRFSGSVVFEERARRIGVVSYSGPALGRRASLRRLGTLAEADQLSRIREAVAALRSAGARIIVLLASTPDEAAVATAVSELEGLDLVIALAAADASSALTPETLVQADGSEVAVLRTLADYGGVGALSMEIDPLGRIDDASLVATLRRVAGAGAATPTTEAEDLLADVVTPLRADLEDLAGDRAAETRVALDGRAASARNGETNFGNLVTDAARGSIRAQANLFRSNGPRAVLADAGILVGDAQVPTGNLSRADVYALVRQGALLGVLQSVAPADLKRLLEFAFANRGTDLFVQITGLEIDFDADGTAQVLDADGSVLTPGTRVVNVRITDDDFLIRDGAVVDGAGSIAIGVTDRIVANYPLGNLVVVNVGITVAQAMDAFLRVTLDQTVGNDDYPATGDGRINDVTPGT